MSNSKKFWLQPVESKIGKWQSEIENLSGSNSFCVLPWIHLATRPNGDMRLCCVSNSSGAKYDDFTVGLVKNENGDPANFATSSPEQAFNNEYMRSVRNLMIQGQVPKSCRKCFEEESKGVVSKRLWETYYWYHDQKIDIENLISQTSTEGTVPFKLEYLDLRLGNECNLKCVMCSPHDSSRWVPDHKKIYPLLSSATIKKQISWDPNQQNNNWYQSPIFWTQIESQISNIKQIYFAGGEPLAIKEHHRFLDRLIETDCAKNIILRYNSNGILIDQDLFERWKNFKKVKFGFSLDGIEDRLEYIRYPTKWSAIENNLNLLDNTPDNIEINLALTVQLLNIKHIPDVIKWKVNKRFKKINLSYNSDNHQIGGGLLSAHLLWIPTWLSIKALPLTDKAEIREIYKELETWLKKHYTNNLDFWELNAHGWNRWKAILDFMDSEDHTALLTDFSEYIDKLDSIRRTDFRKTFPELQHLL